MAIDWYRGEYEYKGGLLKAEAQRRGLAALAKGIEGAKDAYGRYREGGLRGVLDEEYAAEQKEARKEMPKLRAELGEPEPPAADHSQDAWYQKALTALGPKPQVEDTEYRRLQGRVAAEKAETARVRAVSPLFPYTRRPGGLLPKGGKWDFARELEIEHPRGEPKPEKEADPAAGYSQAYRLAWKIATDKARADGRTEATGDEIDAELRVIEKRQAQLKAEYRPEPQARQTPEWQDRLTKAHDYLVAKDPQHREPSPQAVYDLANSWRPKTAAAGGDVPDFLKPNAPEAAAAPHGGDEQPAVDPNKPDPDADAAQGLNQPAKNPDEPPPHKDARVNPREGSKALPAQRRPGGVNDPQANDDDEILWGQPHPTAPQAGADDEDDDDFDIPE